MCFKSAYACLFLVCLSSCVEIETYDNTPRDNFEALWKIMDEHYCFFEYKNVDWQQVHDDYSLRIQDKMSDEDLFAVLNEMLQEVKDGHVNLVSVFDVGRYWKWFEDYPANYKSELIEQYLGFDYRIAGGLYYKVLPDDSIGYIRYSDFSSSIGNQALNYIFTQFKDCPGIILDVRNNGGGYLSYSTLLASRFFEQKTRIGYIQHKTGTGHNDFSEPVPQYITPSEGVRPTQKVVVLTNRKCYSACNDFINAIRYAPKVITMGDRSGGGSGLPFSSELPNGWYVRFSACPTYNAEMQHIESGIEPDVPMQLSDIDVQNGKDTLIEEAILILKTE
ncbi:MAG: S41 family peptidase [Candidatus Symbiothrix sp.]|nr:S41 family peptidase [Candidatus Symbiothrix sp.]